MSRNEVPMNATYFREYGLHPVKQAQGSGQDYIASFPDWEQTIDALKTDMPKKGNIITPEYITAPGELSDIRDDIGVISDRVREALDATRRSDATLYLGTPTMAKFPDGQTRVRNSVHTIHKGAIESTVHKTTLVPAEREFINTPEHDARTINRGNAVLICAELYAYCMQKDHSLQGKDVKQIFAPTAWAHPNDPSSNQISVERAGGEDAYYRQQLEVAVGSYLLHDLPSVQRVVISDRGLSNLAPYNAVFDRVK